MNLKDLSVDRYRLESTLQLEPTPGRERYIHLLVGECEVYRDDDDGVPLGPRYSVFHPPTSGLFERFGSSVRISPRPTADILVVTAPTPKRGGVNWTEIITPQLHKIGDGNHARDVYEILGGEGTSQSIRFGETFNVRGGWSSWPPHSFDYEQEHASQFEEVFVPFMRPRNGYALMRRKGVFYDGQEVDDAVVLRTGEMASVPLGFHPIVGAPDTELMYVWAYLSPVPKVYAKFAEDVGQYQ